MILGLTQYFTEQGLSASHMTAAKVLDVIARLLGCAGQPSDAVSAHMQLRREDAPNVLKPTNSEYPDISDTVTKTHVAEERGRAFNNLWFRVKGMCTDTPWLDCIGRDSSRRFCSEMDVRKNPLGNACLCYVSRV